MARAGYFKKAFVSFLDEAHHAGRNIGSEDSIYRLNAFELIAKGERMD